ncbi:MAG: hypothetical protein ACRD2I_13415 [Vicinamibacterales bacterium]
MVTNLQNRLESWSVFTAPVNLRTESGEHVEWDWIPTFEHLDLPFEISVGVVIPPGSYRWTRYRSEVNTATKRWWVIDAAVGWGGFYGGTLEQVEFGVALGRAATWRYPSRASEMRPSSLRARSRRTF